MIRIWWRRQRAFIDFCLSTLLRRKMKNGALLAGYALIVFLLVSVLFFTASLRKEAVAVLRDAPEITVQRMLAGRVMPIPLDYRETLRKIRGVRQVTPRYWGYYYHPAAQANYTVMAEGDIPPGRTRIGTGVARTWGVHPGGEVYFKTVDGTPVTLTVGALLPADTELVSADLMLVHPSDFQKIFGLPAGLATDFTVAVRNPNEIQTVAEKIVRRLPDTRPVLRDEILRTYGALFDWRSGYILVMLAGALLAFFIFALDKATELSAEERGEIATLKAIGWDTADVLTLKFYEGLVISLSAFLLGAIGAYLHVYLADASLFEHAIKGWGVLYPQLNPVPAVDIYQLAAVLGLTVFPYALMTIIPAWRAATIDPDAVMRQL
ncbi:ABC transporter permease [Desulfosarcina ovata]|uniref:ABC transporter permease n=1 Tax=Desulfosarcina ovata subsp. ovata TaxID=2752305 RepID=A0A5K8AJG9_9BACT|nr:FtsX-like permease family protein [Desulfosarcina ovata]BBO92656.1 ABC transporter permease [Desulfosarcina ovata subsp. ovata]